MIETQTEIIKRLQERIDELQSKLTIVVVYPEREDALEIKRSVLSDHKYMYKFLFGKDWVPNEHSSEG